MHSSSDACPPLSVVLSGSLVSAAGALVALTAQNKAFLVPSPLPDCTFPHWTVGSVFDPKRTGQGMLLKTLHCVRTVTVRLGCLDWSGACLTRHSSPIDEVPLLQPAKGPRRHYHVCCARWRWAESGAAVLLWHLRHLQKARKHRRPQLLRPWLIGSTS